MDCTSLIKADFKHVVDSSSRGHEVSSSLFTLTYNSSFTEELHSPHCGGQKWHVSLLLGVVWQNECAEGVGAALGGCETQLVR